MSPTVPLPSANSSKFQANSHRHSENVFMHVQRKKLTEDAKLEGTILVIILSCD